METIKANSKPRGGGERQKNKVVSGQPAMAGSGKTEHFLLAGSSVKGLILLYISWLFQ